MDFNTQRKVVSALKEKGRNPLLFIPCLIARYAVVIFMSACRGIDMALSDKDGNFLGIKPRQKKAPDYSKEMKKLESKPDSSLRKKSENVPHRSFGLRLASFVMAFAFAFMILPGADAFALEMDAAGPVIGLTLPITDKALISSSDLANNKQDVSILEISQGNVASAAIANNTFIGMPLLTTVKLDYTDTMTIGSNNFTKIAPDAKIYINVPTRDLYNNAVGALGTAGRYAVWDFNGQASALIPDTVQTVNSYNGIGSVILTWDSVNGANGYKVYKYSNSSYTEVTNASFTTGSGLCRAEIPSASNAIYAVRAYRNLALDYDGNNSPDETGMIFSKYFCNAKPASALTPGAPSIKAVLSGKNISVSFTKGSGCDTPSYAVLFASENDGPYSPVRYFTPAEITTGTAIYNDIYDGTPIKYRAAAYYDIFGKNNGFTLTDYSMPAANPYKEQDYEVYLSNEETISSAKLNPPENFICPLSSDKTTWELDWDIPADSQLISNVVYKLTVNDKVVEPQINGTSYSLPIDIAIANGYVKKGEDVTFGLTAYVLNDASFGESDRVTAIAKVTNDCVQLKSASVGDGSVTLTIANPIPGDIYTLHFVYTDENGALCPDMKKFSAVDCKTDAATGNLIYKFEGLTNGRTYTFSVTSDKTSYSSAEFTGIPSNAPAAPAAVTCTGKEYSADISWSPVYINNSAVRVTGYYVTVKEKATGKIVISRADVPAEKGEYYEAKGLTNDIEYIAEIYSYVEIGSNPPIVSTAPAVSEPFVPTITVNDVLNVSASANDDKQLIQLKWTSVTGATEYKVVRTDPDGYSEEFYVGKATSFNDSSVSNDVLYTYVVHAIRVADGKAYTSESQPVTAKINVTLQSLQGLTATGGDGSVTLKWDKVKNADGYYIECYRNGAWTRVGSVSKSPFTHTGLTNKQEYQYRVIPYIEVNGTPVYSYENAQTTIGTAGIHLPAPMDFTVTVKDNDVTLKWKAVSGAQGYEIYIVTAPGEYRLIDRVSKTTAIHENIPDGTTIEYVVRAYKYVNGEIDAGDYSIPKTAAIGQISLDSPTDVTAKGGKNQVTIKWKKVTGADGYVVYCYNSTGFYFKAVGIVTTTSFTHTGLLPSTSYTYMVAAYQNVDTKPHYSAYSLEVTATTDADKTADKEPGEYRIFITGTTPYGMSNSKYISAFSEKGALTSDIDVRFTLNGDTVTSIQNVLNYYGEGVDSFLIYPMDISLYKSGTDTPAQLNPGYYITLTIPVPDMLLSYSDRISVVHVSDTDQLEILPSSHVNVSGVECIQFTASSFSPYAFVVYLPEITEDTGSDMGMTAQGTIEYETSTSAVLMCTYLPEFIRSRRKHKKYRKINR